MRNAWRYYPWFVAAAMSVVVAVNFGMAYTALHTFPGIAGSDGFDLSNHYNTVIDRMKRQAALGWDLRTAVEPDGRPVVVFTNRNGGMLEGATIEATARRPLGEQRAAEIGFSETTPGRYVGAMALAEKGQWELELSANLNGRAFTTTRRITVR